MSLATFTGMKNRLLYLFSFYLLSCSGPMPAGDELRDQIIKQYQSQNQGSTQELLKVVKHTDSLLAERPEAVYKGLNNFITGAYFTRTDNYGLAIQFMEQAGNNFEGHAAYDSLRLCTYLFLSDLHNSLGKYDEAVKDALTAKAGYEKLNYPIAISKSNLALARIFQAKGDIDRAKSIIKETTATVDNQSKMVILHTLANIYGEQGQLDSALAIDNYVISNQHNFAERFISPFYNNKALCLTELKAYDSALYFFKASLMADSLAGNPDNMSANYNDIGTMFLHKGDLERAKYYNLRALEISNRIGKPRTSLSCYTNLYQLAKISKDYPAAMRYSDSIKIIQNTLDNVALNRGIEELNLVYETAKKEKTIQEQKNTITQNKILLGGISFMVLVVAMLIYNYHRKNKLQQELERMELLQASERAVAEAEQKERQRISRDLHDTSSAYTSALLANIEKLKLKDRTSPELNQMQDNANEILSSLRETIWILNNKEVTITDFSDDFKNYCIKVLRNFENIGFEAEEEIVNNLMLTATTAIHLKRILQEAVQNSIKHSGATEITYWVKSDAQFEITLSDNGKGFDTNAIKYGNGLENMEWRAAQAGVRLSRRSVPGKGTIFCIAEL